MERIRRNWGSVHACIDKQTRMVRIPSPGYGCVRGEKPVAWSVRGPMGTFSTSGYTDTRFCMNKDGHLEGLDKKTGACKDDKVLVSIPVKH